MLIEPQSKTKIKTIEPQAEEVLNSIVLPARFLFSAYVGQDRYKT